MNIRTFADSLVKQAENQKKANTKRREIEERPGGLDEFKIKLKDKFQLVVTSEEHEFLAHHIVNSKAKAEYSCSHGYRNQIVLNRIHEKLAAFYNIYEKCFPIDIECESYQSFTDILTKDNFDLKMMNKIGQYREFLGILRDPTTNQVFGGENFTTYVHGNGNIPTIHGIYSFLAPEYRGFGLSRIIFDLRDQIAINYVNDVTPDALRIAGGIFIFGEQNDFERMDGLSYAIDSAYAIDQVQRLQIWNHLGFTMLKFKYTQPSLAEIIPPCDSLSLNIYFRKVFFSKDGKPALGAIVGPKEISIDVLRNHIRAFCIQSCCGDINADKKDPTTARMLADLDIISAYTKNIVTISSDERKDYLKIWGQRIQALQRLFKDHPLNKEETISMMYMQNKECIEALIKAESDREPNGYDAL